MLQSQEHLFIIENIQGAVLCSWDAWNDQDDITQNLSADEVVELGKEHVFYKKNKNKLVRFIKLKKLLHSEETINISFPGHSYTLNRISNLGKIKLKVYRNEISLIICALAYSPVQGRLQDISKTDSEHNPCLSAYLRFSSILAGVSI